METTESGEDTQNNTNAEERDVLISSEVDENVEMKRDESIKDERDTDEVDIKTNEKDEPDDGTNIEKNSTAQEAKYEYDVEDDTGSTKEKASDDQKNEPDNGTDIEKSTIAQDVKILDENENDVEDDQVSTKEKTLEDEKVVEVAQEDPVETSIEILRMTKQQYKPKQNNIVSSQ